MNKLCLTCWASLVILAAVPNADAHPAHFSFAEVEWNAASGCLEIALRMEAATLERALRGFATSESAPFSENRLTLESPEAAQLVRAYVIQQFEVTTQKGNETQIKWVGFETSLMEAWAYFEVAVPEGPEGLGFQNRILFEEEPEQVNVVNLRDGSRGGTVHLTAKEPQKTIVLTEK